MEHLKQDFLLEPASDEFSRILDSALINEKYLSHITLYKLWIRIYYSLEKICNFDLVGDFCSKSKWATFVHLLLQKKNVNTEYFFTSLECLAQEAFQEAQALLILKEIKGSFDSGDDFSHLYWRLSDLFSQGSVEAAYSLGRIYSGDFTVRLKRRSDVIKTDIASATNVFQFAASARKREAYRQLGLIYTRKNLHVKAKEYYTSAINAGDILSLKLLEISDNCINDIPPDIPPEDSVTEPITKPTTLIPDNMGYKDKAKVKLASKRFLVIDFETTNFIARGGRIMEVGAVEVQDRKITRQYSYLINPKTKVSNRSKKLTSITDEMLRRALPAENILPRLLDDLSGCILVAHNIGFEKMFLHSECERIGIENSLKYISTICTLKRARRLYPGLHNHKLETVMAYLNIPKEGSMHRALPDALATARVLIRMIDDDAQGILEELHSII